MSRKVAKSLSHFEKDDFAFHVWPGPNPPPVVSR